MPRPRSVAALLTVALVAGGSAAGPLARPPAVAHAAPAAPAFSVRLLDSQQTVDSVDLIGKKIVVLRFQASYCKPCGKESAAFGRVVDRYRSRGVEFLALHVQDTAADVRRFVKRHGVKYPVALDPRLTIGNRFGFEGTPYTVVVDRKGEIAAQIHGVSAVAKLPRMLDDLLEAGEQPSRRL